GKDAALYGDPVQYRAVVLERVRTSHRFEPTDQDVIGSIQKEHAGVAVLAQRGHDGGEIVKQPAPSHVDDGRYPRQCSPGALGEIEERLEHLRRKIVDDEPIEI